jgi:hypothetical protein
MATLQLSMMQAKTGRFTLAEHDEQYDQLSHFRNADEVRRELSHLGLVDSQMKDLWDGKEVELDSEHSWPNCP